MKILIVLRPRSEERHLTGIKEWRISDGLLICIGPGRTFAYPLDVV